jgi:hypothetical protein
VTAVEAVRETPAARRRADMVGAWVIGECAGEQCGGLQFLVFQSKKYLPHREINFTILDR